MKPRILLGLGNPGPEYENTPHNMGENAVRAWAAKSRLEFERGDGPFLWTPVRRDVRAVIPTTYMNLSGRAISKLRSIVDFDPKELLVVTDDVWLPFGRLRLRTGGSDGGHNGLKSIAEALGTQAYPRLRVGVGPVPAGADWADFVLAPYPDSRRTEVDTTLQAAREAIGLILARGYGHAQSEINRGPEDEPNGEAATSEEK